MNFRTRSFLLVALIISTLGPTLSLAKENHLVRVQREIDEHTVVVQDKVRSVWVAPSVSAEKLSCAVKVSVSMNGEITASRIVGSSGNPDFDRSVETAIKQSSPLPAASDPEVMDQFRALQFEFRIGASLTAVEERPVESDFGYGNYVRVKSPIYIDK